MVNAILRRFLFTAAVGLPVILGSTTAQAQDSRASSRGLQGDDPDEIIVSARKRQESILNVPVVEVAIPQRRLEQLQVTQLSDLPSLAPGLDLGASLLAIGTQVTIRGVGTSSLDPGVDQSVSLNIDGLSLGQGLAFESGLFDLAQIEVLKGPQALFYGKSSPGGVIALRTADPTDKTEIIARAGYEFEARGPRAELILSGPVTDTLKLRLAGNYSTSKGYFRNVGVPITATGAENPQHGRNPNTEDYMVRGTALWNPSSQFDARLKVNLTHSRMEGDTYQYVNCPDGAGAAPAGVPFLGGDDCKLDRKVRIVSMNPANFPGIYNNGDPYNESRQRYGTLELNYRPLHDLTLTSATAYYHVYQDALANATYTTAAAPAIVAQNKFRRRQFTEEIRLNSEFSTPLNFTAGAFYEDGRMDEGVIVLGNSAYGLPGLITNNDLIVDIKTYSLFGQLRWKIIPELELTGGARWTDETRIETVNNRATTPPTPVRPLVPRIHSSNVAPEVTLTYRPTGDLTVFAAYKKGYKSGSFGLSSTPDVVAQGNQFGDEQVHGEEAGIKSRLFDRQLALNIAAYNYRYTGLQVGAVNQAQGNETFIRTVNAASSRVYGIDFDTAYRPNAIAGLELNAAVSWNHARYKVFTTAPCYGGQTIAAGCNQLRSPATGLFTAQDLSGTPLIRAPKWELHAGFDYEFPVGRDLTVTISNNNKFSSKYVTFLAIGRPNNDNYQKSFFKSDLGLSVRSNDGLWEASLIGKNVFDKITVTNCSASNSANGAIFGGQITGGTGAGPAGVDEASCWANPGREIWLRLTFRPFASAR